MTVHSSTRTSVSILIDLFIITDWHGKGQKHYWFTLPQLRGIWPYMLRLQVRGCHGTLYIIVYCINNHNMNIRSSPKTVPITFLSNSKPLVPHLMQHACVYFYARTLAYLRAVWSSVPKLHPLWQGKGAFLNLQRLTSAFGYRHYRCFIIMLWYSIRGKGTGNVCEWEALTRGTQGKRGKSVAPHLLRVTAQSLSPELQTFKSNTKNKIKSLNANWWPDWILIKKKHFTVTCRSASHPLGLFACFLCKNVKKV